MTISKTNIPSVIHHNLLLLLITAIALLLTACGGNASEEHDSSSMNQLDISQEIQPVAESTATLPPTPDPLIELANQIFTLVQQANESYIRGDRATWRETTSTVNEYVDEFDRLTGGLQSVTYDEIGFASEEAFQASLGNLLIARGNEAYNNDEDEKEIALQNFNQAIELGAEQLSAAYSGRGHVFRFLDNTADAIPDFNQAIELDPENADAYRGLAQLTYYSQSDLTTAKEYIDRALSINPSFAKVYFLRADIAYYELGDAASAETLYTQGLQYDPKDDAGYYFRAVMYEELGRVAECLDDINIAINIKPIDGWYYYQRGYCYTGLGQYAIALDDFDTAISLAGSDSSLIGYAYGGKGGAYSRLGKYTESIDALSTAIQQHPDNVRFFVWRADAYRLMENHQAAIEDYTQALGIDASYNWSYFGLGLAHDNLNHYQDAYENYALYLERELGDISETRYACDRMNTLHLYNSQNLFDMFLGVGCNRFPSNSSGSYTSGGNDSQDSCTYGVISGVCVRSLSDCPYGITPSVGGGRCYTESEAGALQSSNP